MKFAVFCFFIFQQLTFEIIKAQSLSSPHIQFEPLRGKSLNSYSIHQYENVSPTNNEKTVPVFDKEFTPYFGSKNDMNPSLNNLEQKYSYHTQNTWNQNVRPNNVDQIPYLIYNSGNQPLKNSNSNYLPGIITKTGDAVKETADENHNAFKNSINSLVAAGVANTNAGKDLIQSGLAFGTSFPRFGSKLFGQSDSSHQKNGFNIGGFPF
ncbi:uncharacterized protein [Chelonus insularis]|uniref:uncharacterized protein n=1 Tax=Chelonus insularis TaxID=460826 RepID=UPI00158BC08D|nr:uncharacterized protein LOC118069015 [Chelonus insularis]